MLFRRDFFGYSESRCARDEISAGVMIIALSPWRSSAVRWRDGSLGIVMLSDSTSGFLSSIRPANHPLESPLVRSVSLYHPIGVCWSKVLSDEQIVEVLQARGHICVRSLFFRLTALAAGV